MMSEWNRISGGKILKNEKLTTPSETSTAASFSQQIPHAQNGTEFRPPP
jgi:hypothetical protein